MDQQQMVLYTRKIKDKKKFKLYYKENKDKRPFLSLFLFIKRRKSDIIV